MWSREFLPGGNAIKNRKTESDKTPINTVQRFGRETMILSDRWNEVIKEIKS
jgi:hypothetical protein